MQESMGKMREEQWYSLNNLSCTSTLQTDQETNPNVSNTQM